MFRLSFGLAVAMAVTPARQVTSGYFRVHLYVLMGLNVLAALAAAGGDSLQIGLPLVAAAVSYAGSVFWLYELGAPGKAALAIVAALSLAANWILAPPSTLPPIASLLHKLDPLAGGLVLGTTLAAMLLGHWYLNSPTMKIDPLDRLVVWMGLAIAARAALCGLALGLEVAQFGTPSTQQLLLVTLRWMTGLVGAGIVVFLTRATLRVPNTQSATGLLYVGVIVTFVGELTSLLLSGEFRYPV